MKKVTVIGNGALSLSVAARMSNRGAAVTFVDVAGKDTTCAPAMIHVTGLEAYDAEFTEITHEYSSVAESELVVITATGSYHAKIFEKIVPMMHSGQTVLFFPACFGAINFLAAVRERNVDITVCEAVSFVCVCEMQGKDTLCIQNLKNSMRLAVKPADRTADTIDELNTYFDVFTPARNFLETSLDNMNMTLHPLPLLLNVSAAERNTDTFRHYIDGISPTVGRLTEQLDCERMQIGEAFGLNLTCAYDQLVQYYGERNLPTLTEYTSSELGPYTAVKGYGLESRYICEDVPYLLVAAAALGKSCGVKTPVMDLCITLASMISQKDYAKEGYSLERMGLNGLSCDEIIKSI